MSKTLVQLENELNVLKADLNSKVQSFNDGLKPYLTPPEIVITTAKNTSDQVYFSVAVKNQKTLETQVKVSIFAYDFGVSKWGSNIRGSTKGPNADWYNTNTVEYKLIPGSNYTNAIDSGPDVVTNADDFHKACATCIGWSMLRSYAPNTPPSFDTAWKEPTHHEGHAQEVYPSDDIEPTTLESQCNYSKSATVVPAMGNADWGDDFSTTAALSWNFSPPASAVTTVQLPHAKFTVLSIANNCVIAPSVTLVAGFFTCKTLTIQARTQALYMIGTFMVGALSIDPTAVVGGIYWSNIHHPVAVATLKANNVLAPFTAAKCPTIPTTPLWSPVATEENYTDFQMCSSDYLRTMAGPFTWSTVDPVCGIPPNATGTAALVENCKTSDRPLRYRMIEISRSLKL